MTVDLNALAHAVLYIAALYFGVTSAGLCTLFIAWMVRKWRAKRCDPGATQ